jgi:hypothetical protein
VITLPATRFSIQIFHVLPTQYIYAFYMRLGTAAGGEWVSYSAPVQTGRGSHPANYRKGTGAFPGVHRPGRGVDHPPLLAPRLKIE